MSKVIEALEMSIKICSRTGLIADEKVIREALTQARLDEAEVTKLRERQVLVEAFETAGYRWLDALVDTIAETEAMCDMYETREAITKYDADKEAMKRMMELVTPTKEEHDLVKKEAIKYE